MRFMLDLTFLQCLENLRRAFGSCNMTATLEVGNDLDLAGKMLPPESHMALSLDQVPFIIPLSMIERNTN
jgi:hypothetical protein